MKQSREFKNKTKFKVKEVDPALDAAVSKMVEALEGALPFARHVSVCENHDGSKFQELAEEWMEATDKALEAYRSAVNEGK